ncbi:inhibitor of Bruton tyrosine kinase-like [Ornithodoros turicata]|uniref:inhibitor of Bruton tyrosine kinase-like n=1 Tax=Ornithodoros turicata TaxID=34597 RepID=UPI003138F9A9
MSASMFMPECTSKCRSQKHAALLLSAVTKGTVPEIQTYCRYLCHNFWTVSDAGGRTALHLAATVGKVDLVEWLLHQCHAEVDVRDKESGWTPLHRAIFHGQLHCARSFLRCGASLTAADREGLTPLDVAVRDRLPYIEYSLSDPCEVYVWGSNENFTLGLASEQSPKHPELVEAFRRDGVAVTKVEMQKFHSVFLTNTGGVYTCGHGLGGRLGLNCEETVLTVTQVPAVRSSRCLDVATGQDHTVFLMEDGRILTCGLNTYHQLGHLPPPVQLLSPKPILLKFMKQKKIVGICAARYHSVVYTKDAVYTFGLNAGQLGHPKGDRLQTAPRQVSALSHADVEFTHVISANGAVVCATKKGDVYVLHEYQCRKIASRQLEIKKLCVVGGQLDYRCDVAGIREGGGHELKVVMLTRSGKIYLWQGSNPVLTRCLFNTVQQVSVKDVCLNEQNIGIVSRYGEGFVGFVTAKKEQRKKGSDSFSSKTCLPPTITSNLVTFLDRDECEYVRLKRIQYVNRANAIACSGSGQSFAVLQSHPKVGLLEFPTVDASAYQADFLQLLEGADGSDCVHDIVLRVKNTSYPLHRYILMSRSDFFQKVASKVSDGSAFVIDDVSPKAVEVVLCFIYTNSCSLLEQGGYENVVRSSSRYGCSRKTTAAFVREVQGAAKKLGVHSLAKRLDKAKVSDNRVHFEHVSAIPKQYFDRGRFSHLYDVTLVSSDGIEFGCHRCVLVARLEYFGSMLSLGWAEASQHALSLPLPGKVLSVLLDFLYTDDCVQLRASEDIEFLCHVLVAADQLLVTRLKQMCEATLSDLVTLKNVAELLELSYIYNAGQLKDLCMHYMCINIPAMLESSALDALSDDVIQDLTTCYKEMVPAMKRRVVTPYPDDPCHQVIERVFLEYGHLFDGEDSFHFTKPSESKSKARRRCQVRRESENVLTTLATSPPEPIPQHCSNIGTNSASADVHDVRSSEKPIVPKKKVIDVHSVRIEPVTSTPVPLRSRTASVPSTQENVSVGSPASETCVPLLQGMFPTLGEVADATGKSLKSFSPSDPKRATKISQKQRKQMLASKSTDSNFLQEPCSPPPSSCPWFHNTPPQSPPTSFWDSKPQSPSSPINGTPAKKGSAAFPDLSVGSPPSDMPSMTEILKDEEAKVHNLRKMKPKALDIINIEDRAIEELSQLYQAEDNPEERISVVRVLPEAFAAPVWRRKY